jgi:integrase
MAALAKNYNYTKTEEGNIIQLIKMDEPKQSTNKKKGKKSEVYPYEIEDAKRMLNFFKENNSWLHYLLLTFGCNMARRVGDTLSLKWYNIYEPETGKMRRDILEIQEDKTDKLANPRINKAVREAIELYIDNTGCNPSDNGYNNYIFLQLSGTHKGAILSESGHLKALKRAAKELGIEYNIGTHSARKFFGMMNRMLHPGDYDSMEILQTIYNHSDTKTTKHYIGLTKQKVDKYYDDMGDFYSDYIVGDKEYSQVADKPIVSLDTNDLRDIVKAAYEAGKENADTMDAMVHVDAITSIMDMIESLAK